MTQDPSDTSTPQAGPRPGIVLAGLVLVLAGVAAYHNSLGTPFVFDDRVAIVENRSIRDLGALGNVFWPPRTGGPETGRPMLNLSFALNYAAGGLDPVGYHLANLLIHILAALTLLGVCRRTFLLPALRARWGGAALPVAFAAALLWELHPLLTDAVTYTSSRSESLMGLCYLLTLYAVIRGAGSPRPGVWYAGAALACAAGMGTKEVMVSAPVMVLLYDRALLAGSFRAALRQRRGLYAALAAGWLVLALSLASAGTQHGGAAGFGLGMTWWRYGLTQCVFVVRYLRLCVWPAPLILDYGWPLVHNLWRILPCAAALGLLLAATVWALRTRKPLGLLGAWFFLILAPSSSVLPLVWQTAAERRMYLPLAAVIVGAVVGACRLWESLAPPEAPAPPEPPPPEAAEPPESAGGSWRRWRVPAVVLLGLALLLGVLTVRRNSVYASGLSIWEDTVAKVPDNPRARYTLGTVRAAEGDDPGAIEAYRAALRFEPNYVEAHHNLANALARTGQTAEAEDQYRQALRLNPHLAATHDKLGQLLAQQGRLAEAIKQFAAALAEEPQLAQAHFDLGQALWCLGRQSEALGQFERALTLAPQTAGYYQFAARLLATTDADHGGNPARALEYARQACTLTGGADPWCLDTLAAAEAAAGQYDRAVATAAQAVHAAEGLHQPALAAEIRTRKDLYRTGRPFCEVLPTTQPAATRPADRGPAPSADQ
jgi:tetratricopeptide (TPR) repeat protein